MIRDGLHPEEPFDGAFAYDLLMDDADAMDSLLASHQHQQQQQQRAKVVENDESNHQKFIADFNTAAASGSHEPSPDAYNLDEMAQQTHEGVPGGARTDDLSVGVGDATDDDGDDGDGDGDASDEKPAPRKRRKKNAEQKCSAVGCCDEIKLTARNDGEHPLCEMHKRAAVARCTDGAEVCFCFYCNKAHGVEVRVGGCRMIRTEYSKMVAGWLSSIGLLSAVAALKH